MIIYYRIKTSALAATRDIIVLFKSDGESEDKRSNFFNLIILACLLAPLLTLTLFPAYSSGGAPQIMGYDEYLAKINSEPAGWIGKCITPLVNLNIYNYLLSRSGMVWPAVYVLSHSACFIFTLYFGSNYFAISNLSDVPRQ